MKFEIKSSRNKNEVLFEHSAENNSLRSTVEAAVRADVDLAEADLSKADLGGANLPGAKLSGANLRRVDLRWADLSGANLVGANLAKANITFGTNLDQANLAETNLSEAKLRSGTNFSGVNLSGADLTQADFGLGLNFSQADLSGANLCAARFCLVNFQGADLSGANLKEADFGFGSDLRDARLSKANLVGTRFGDARLTGAVFDDGRRTEEESPAEGIWAFPTAEENDFESIGLLVSDTFETIHEASRAHGIGKLAEHRSRLLDELDIEARKIADQRKSLEIVGHGAALKARRQFPPSPPPQIVVLGTMSAGKSTLLNALIGQEILPTANLATTACPVRIEHQPGIQGFAGMRYGKKASLLERRIRPKPETLSLWNRLPGTSGIGLRGPFLMSPRPAAGLVLYDTPGPNNSQNARHRQTMRLALRNIDFQALIYVMNAQHPATNEDRATLESLREELRGKSKYKIWFILNKTDSFDREKGESLRESVSGAAKYLRKTGFADPLIIIPAFAHAALYAKKALFGQDLTRRQDNDLRHALELLSERGERMMQAALIPDLLRLHWREQLKEWTREIAERIGLDQNSKIDQIVAVASARIDALENEQEDVAGRLENHDLHQTGPRAENTLAMRLAEIEGELKATRSCVQKLLLSASGITALEFLLCHGEKK
jgi:uncharacterized protein YjbI with pentapeptide repeats/GTP-binding protein EngB required for normal cell division